MSRFNTGNPLGSGSPLDLDDNAKNLDEAMNSNEAAWTDRFGRPRRSMAGVDVAVAGVEAAATVAIEQTIPEIIADTDAEANAILDTKESEWDGRFQLGQAERVAEFNTAQTSREQQFSTFIASSGYQFVGDYATDIEITQYNQLVRDENGEFWRVSGPTQLPYTTTGAGMPEGGAFVNVGDAAVRQDFQKGQLRSTNYTTDRVARRGGLNAHSINLTTEVVRPVVSFIDDDGHRSFLTKLKPIFDSKGVKPALAIYTYAPDNLSATMTWKEIIDLYDEGYEILSHTHTDKNLTGVSAPEAEYEFSQSRYELESRGIDVESFVYVQGIRGSSEVKNLVRKYFRSAYVTYDRGIQQQPLQDWFVRRIDAVAQTVATNPTLQELKDLVDYAEANNEWAVFTTHAAYAGLNTTQQQVISDLIDYIQGKGIEILSPSEALDIHGSRFFTGDSSDELFQTRPDLHSDFFKIDKHGVPYPAGARVSPVDGRDQASPITDYAPNEVTVFRPNVTDDWSLDDGSNAVVVETYYIQQFGAFGFQRITQERSGETRHRSWNRTTGDWDDWRQYEDRQYLGEISDGSKLITDYPADSISTEKVPYLAINFPENSDTAAGLLVTYCGRFGPTQNTGYQVYTPNRRPLYFTRTWDYVANQWRDWVKEQQITQPSATTANDDPDRYTPIIRAIGVNSANALTVSMPENSAGTLLAYNGGGRVDTWDNYQTYHVFRSDRMYHRYYDDQAAAWSDWKLIAGGATGTFTTADSKTVTVTNGIITDIS